MFHLSILRRKKKKEPINVLEQYKHKTTVHPHTQCSNNEHSSSCEPYMIALSMLIYQAILSKNWFWPKNCIHTKSLLILSHEAHKKKYMCFKVFISNFNLTVSQPTANLSMRAQKKYTNYCSWFRFLVTDQSVRWNINRQNI